MVTFFPFTQVDPAIKIVAAFCFAVGVSQLATPAMSATACLFGGVTVLLGDVSWKMGLKRLIPVNLFFLALWLMLPITVSDSPYIFADFGLIKLSMQGVFLALTITLKGNAIALVILCLIDTSSVSENARAMLRLNIPRKFVTLLLLTYINLSVMQQESTRILDAAKLRGFSSKFSFISLKTYGWVIGLLLVRSWQRSLRIKDAMTLRGFSGLFPVIAPRKNNVGGFFVAFIITGIYTSIPLFLLIWESLAK